MSGWIADNILAMIAIVVSIVTFLRQRKADKNIRFLKERDLIHKEEDRLAAKAEEERSKVRVRMTRDRVIIWNDGRTTVYDVDLKMKPERGGSPPLVPADVEIKLPIDVLHPGEERQLYSAPSQSSPPPFETEVYWTDSKGRPHSFSTLLDI